MELKYFINCKNLADLDDKYQEICRVFGPDAMQYGSKLKQEVEREYNALSAQMRSQTTNQGKDEFTMKYILDRIKLLNLTGELIGKWLWITDERAHGLRSQLRSMGFKFSHSKRSWYWRRWEDRSSNENPVPLEAIREKYGSQSIVKS